MARIPLIHDKDQLAGEHHPIFDSIAASRGEVAGPFPLLLHDPKLARCIADLGTHIRFESPLTAPEQKLITLVVAAETNSAYLWTFHAPLARQLGLPDLLIDAIKSKADALPMEGEIIGYARALLRANRVEDALFEALLARFGAAGLTTLTATIGYYAMLAYLMTAFDVRA